MINAGIVGVPDCWEEVYRPVLDRLAFLVEPEGIRIHWITDARYDRTTLDPANEFAVVTSLRQRNAPGLRWPG